MVSQKVNGRDKLESEESGWEYSGESSVIGATRETSRIFAMEISKAKLKVVCVKLKVNIYSDIKLYLI